MPQRIVNGLEFVHVEEEHSDLVVGTAVLEFPERDDYARVLYLEAPLECHKRPIELIALRCGAVQ